MKSKINYRKDRMIVLLKEYCQIKDDLLDYTEVLHDSMHWDIEGYWESIMEENYDDMETLEVQVTAFKMILEGFQKINYVYC